jgi:hypothetical protein
MEQAKVRYYREIGAIDHIGHTQGADGYANEVLPQRLAMNSKQVARPEGRRRMKRVYCTAKSIDLSVDGKDKQKLSWILVLRHLEYLSQVHAWHTHHGGVWLHFTEVLTFAMQQS